MQEVLQADWQEVWHSQYKGEKMGIREMRKHTAWYTTGMHGSSTLRNKVNQVETFDALQELLMR